MSARVLAQFGHASVPGEQILLAVSAFDADNVETFFPEDADESVRESIGGDVRGRWEISKGKELDHVVDIMRYPMSTPFADETWSTFDQARNRAKSLAAEAPKAKDYQREGATDD